MNQQLHDPAFHTHQMRQQQYNLAMQQLELERIRQVQQQAALQQQQALFYQQIMYYQQHHSDGLVNDCIMANNQYSPASSASPPNHTIGQFGHQQESFNNDGTKAQKRAEHNAIERARRESLNSKFQQLAHSLPNLQNDRRPSKGTIIERTLEYVKQTVQKEERFQSEIDKLRQANENLIHTMTNDHFETDTIPEEDEEEDEDYFEYESTHTPECDDNFSSRSSVTSTSSHHLYSFTEHPPQTTNFEKQQGNTNVMFLV